MKFIEEQYEEVFQSLIYYLKDEIRTEYPETKLRFKVLDTYNHASKSIIPIQLWYDHINNLMYIYFELDNHSRYDREKDPKKIYLRYFSRIYNNIYKDLGIHPVIVGPCNELYIDPTDGRVNSKVDLANKLTIDTATYWKCFDNSYKFISNYYIIRRHLEPHLRNNTYSSVILSLMDKCAELNTKYNYSSNEGESVPSGFEEYKEHYKNITGFDIYGIPDKEVHYAFLQIDYDE